MKSLVWITCLASVTAAGAAAALKPVAFRLASLPASAEPGQKLVLCAANVGTGAVDVSLEFINVGTGSVVAANTVTLAPLGAGAAAPPCVTVAAESLAGTAPNPAGSPGDRPAASAFVPSSAAAQPAEGRALLVGVALVRKPLLSFREAQVTASIQVLAPDAHGVLRTVETIPLSRATHPSDGAPVYAPPPADSGHHK